MENRIDTIQDLEYYYPSWREDPSIAIRSLIRDKNYNSDIIDIIINDPQASRNINYNELAFDLIELLNEPFIYNLVVQGAEKNGQKLDVNALAVQAAEENRLGLVETFLEQGANNYQEILEGATTSFSLPFFRSLIERYKHEHIDYHKLLLSATLAINVDILKYLIPVMLSPPRISIDFYQMIIVIMDILGKTPTPKEVKEFEIWLLRQTNRSLENKTLSIIYTDLGRLDALKMIFNTYQDIDLRIIALIASKNGSFDIIQWVIEKDTNKSLIDNEIIEYAITNNNNEIAKYLIEYTIKIKIYHEHNIPYIIATMAVESYNIEITEWIIDYSIKLGAPVNITQLILKLLKDEDNNNIDMAKKIIEYAIKKSHSFNINEILLKAYEKNNINLVIWLINLNIELDFQNLTNIISELIKNDNIELGMKMISEIFQGEINIGNRNMFTIPNIVNNMIENIIDDHINLATQIIDLAIIKKFPIGLGYLAHHALQKNNIDLLIWLVNKAIDNNLPFDMIGYIIDNLYKQRYIDIAMRIIEKIILHHLQLPRDKDIYDIVEVFGRIKDKDIDKLLWFINKVIEIHTTHQLHLDNEFFTKIVNVYMKYTNLKVVEMLINMAINKNLPINLNEIIKFLFLANNLQGVKLINKIARNNNIKLNINITENEMSNYLYRFGYGENDTDVLKYIRIMSHTRPIQEEEEEEGRQLKRQRNIPIEQQEMDIEQPEEITREERHGFKRQNVSTEEEEEMNVEQPEEMDIGQRFKKQKKRILYY